MNNSTAPNGQMPQTHGLAVDTERKPGSSALRIPTVHEALPYTPFSSIVPFNADLITPPSTLPTTTPTAFSNDEDVTLARRELDRLSRGASRAEQASAKCKQTLNDVRRLLKADSITQFKFKTTKRIRSPEPGRAFKPPTLSPFAQMVFDGTNVSYITSESEPPGRAKATAQNGDGAKTAAQESKFAQVQVAARPSTTLLEPSIPVETHEPRPTPPTLGQVLQHSQTPQNSSQSRPQLQTTPRAFVQPTALTPAQLAEYQKVAVPDYSPSQASLSMNENKSAHLVNGARATSVDQRHKADRAVGSLQSLLQIIFEAEDQMQPDTSDVISVHPNTVFINREGAEGSVPVLNAEVQSKLDAAFAEIIAYGRLDDISVEHMIRVQRLCESSIAACTAGSLHIGEDWSEQDTQEWLYRVAGTQAGLVAARTIMRIMTGGSHHSELQSEDYLRSVLDALRTVIEQCVVPVVEERSVLGEKVKGEKSAPRNHKFDIALDNRKSLLGVVTGTIKALRLMGNMLFKTDVDESSISSVEYLCKSLIFAENASSDKEAALGVQAFENLRVCAMDVLALIFTKYTSQRNFIFDEILLSLEKLPATKQSARQFKPIDTKPIQLVSALLMRLVQTSATMNDKPWKMHSNGVAEAEDDHSGSEDSDASYESDENVVLSAAGKQSRNRKRNKLPDDFQSVYAPLQASAQNHASYIVGILLQRASKTSKTSDEPFRKLLDIFTDDFLNVLGSSDWPAAEMLLRTLVSQMVTIADNPKSPAPSRTLALELLGTIGSGILDMQATTAMAARGLEMEDAVTEGLVDMARRSENGGLSADELAAFDGPYRVVLEYLRARGLDNSPQLQTARGYHLVQWAGLVRSPKSTSADQEAIAAPSQTKDIQSKIRCMIEDVHWLEENSQFPGVSTSQGKLASKIVAANSLLCKAFSRIFNTILQSMSSEQPTVRSRSLKSVTTLLEKDPSVLDRNAQIMNQIIRTLGDASSLVRDSALVLIQKCVSLRPALELKVYERIIPRTNDAAVPVRKRSMAFLKQVYLRNKQKGVRAAISNALLSRIKDLEEGVADVAKATIEEIWFTALTHVKTSGDRSVDHMLQLRSHAALIIETVDMGDNVASILEDLIKVLLTKSKQKAENLRICKMLVAALFDGILNNKDIPGEPLQSTILRTLAVFARAAPKLFTAAQLELLGPYAKNLQTSDDLDVYHYVVTILRHTLPVLPDIPKKFLDELQKELLQSIGKIPKSELSAVTPCIWTVEGLLGGTGRPLRTTVSALDGVYGMKTTDLHGNMQLVKKASRLLPILGSFGKTCDFDTSLDTFKNKQNYTWFKGDSVAGLLVEVICQFTSPGRPMPIREAALEAVCGICQTHPEHFLRVDVTNAIHTVFQDRTGSLEQVLLTDLETFFAAASVTTPGEEQEILGTGVESGTQRLGNTYQATGYDTASASLSQRFLPEFLRIALSSSDDLALAAARIVAHINSNGMAHPRESGPSLIALETCPNSAIAKLAFMAHKEQYMKHEGVFAQTLLKAVQQAFEYQQCVVQDPSGYTGQPPAAKLHFFWEVLKQGKSKIRTKLFTSVCASLDFDPAKIKASGSAPQHLLYVRFCVENLALLEHDSIQELLHLLKELEKTFAGTGTSVAQAIESEVLKLHIPGSSSQAVDGNVDAIAVALPGSAPIATAADDFDPARLGQLAVSAQILLLIWETRTYLKRVWNMQKYIDKPKNAAKEINKAPSRATTAPALTEAYIDRVKSIVKSASDEAGQRATCSSFVEIITVDSEVKVGSAEDDDVDLEGEDDAPSERSFTKSPSAGPRGKKRKSMDADGGPTKKRPRSRKSSSAKKMDQEDDDDWV